MAVFLRPRNRLDNRVKGFIKSQSLFSHRPVIPMENFSFIRRLSQLGTRLDTLMHGAVVGTDAFGNRYYRGRKTPAGVRERRWVVYVGEPEASKVPAEWHIWLHHMADAPLPESSRKVWQKQHIPNRTGTRDAYVPSACVAQGGKRPKATGDYDAWQPNE